MVYFYNSMDAVLILSRYEGSSNVLSEAMACGTVVIINKCDELLKDSKNYQKKIVIDFEKIKMIMNTFF